jgi:hypothetical protein
MDMLLVYSSLPDNAQLGSAFIGVRRAGLSVEVLPLSMMPATSTGRKDLLRLRDQRNEVTQLLANIGLKLDMIESGTLLPDAGEEQGLRADRDALHARQRGLVTAIQKLEGGPSHV